MSLIKLGDYEIEGCIDDGDDVIIGQTLYASEFFGVYIRIPPGADGHRPAQHIADFDLLSDAIEFAELKNSKETS